MPAIRSPRSHRRSYVRDQSRIGTSRVNRGAEVVSGSSPIGGSLPPQRPAERGLDADAADRASILPGSRSHVPSVPYDARWIRRIRSLAGGSPMMRSPGCPDLPVGCARDRRSRIPGPGGDPDRSTPSDPAGDGDVRARRRHVAHERVDLGGGRGSRHDRQRRPVRDRARGAGLGRLHPDRQQGRRPHRPQAGLRPGPARLRRSAPWR